MKRPLLLSLFAVALLMCSASNSHAQAKRAMWVWNTNDILNDVNGARQTLFDFCAEPPGSQDALTVPEASQSITTLYLYCHSYVNGDSAKKARLRSFLRDAHAEGIEVEYLDGASDWATTDKGFALTFLDHALNFNASASSSNEKFDGIQFDVEPYLLDTWFSTSLWTSFMDLITIAQHKVDSVGGLRFGVAIPRWYDANPGREYLVQLQSLVDYVAVMNYTDKAQNMINDASNEIKIADSLGKKVILGSETLLIDPSSVTFAQEGWSNMEARLFDVNRKHAANESFAGIAIHEYDPYATLSKYGSAGVDATAPATITSNYFWASSNGAVRVKLADICGTGVSTSGSTTGSKVTLGGSTLAGSWTSSNGYLNFAPTTSLDMGGALKIMLSPTDIQGNMRRDTLTYDIAARAALVSPAHLGINTPLSLLLKWRKSAHATWYKVQLSLKSSFATLLLDTTVSDTTFSVSGLLKSKAYYWRVIAGNLVSTTKPSASRKFTTTSVGEIVMGSDFDADEPDSNDEGITASLLSEELTYAAPAIAVYPNPATQSTSVSIDLQEASIAEISIYGETGGLLQVVRHGMLPEGNTTLPLSVDGLAQGTYYIRLIIGTTTYATRLQVVR